MKKLLVKLLVVVMVVLTISETSFADIRIRFPRGRTSATMSGRIGSGGRICYVARANVGQILTATVSSRSGQVRIFESGETSYQMEVEYSGDQTVCVDNLRGATTYSLTVSIR